MSVADERTTPLSEWECQLKTNPLIHTVENDTDFKIIEFNLDTTWK